MRACTRPSGGKAPKKLHPHADCLFEPNQRKSVSYRSPNFFMGDRHIPTFSLNPESIEGSREKEIFSLAPNPKTLEGLREPFEGLRAEGRPAGSDQIGRAH